MGFQQGLSGLSASSRSLDVIGHNIANANTTGFKQGRAEFGDVMASSIGATGAGTIGIGVQVNTVAQQFTQGNLTITNNDLDVAINGTGFFTLKQTDGSTAYTRAGNFKLDKSGNIVTNDGAILLGYPTNAAGVRTSVTLQAMQMPTASPIAAQVTSEITTQFNLDSSADIWNSVTPTTPLTKYGTAVTGYDTQGNEVPVQLYFRKIANDIWQVYTDASSDYAANQSQVAVLQFASNGTLLNTYGATPSASGPNVWGTANFTWSGSTYVDSTTGNAGVTMTAGGTTLTTAGGATTATFQGNLLDLNDIQVSALDLSVYGTYSSTTALPASATDGVVIPSGTDLSTLGTFNPATGVLTIDTPPNTAAAALGFVTGGDTVTVAGVGTDVGVTAKFDIDLDGDGNAEIDAGDDLLSLGTAAGGILTLTSPITISHFSSSLLYTTTVESVDTDGDGTSYLAQDAETPLSAGTNPTINLASPNTLIGNWKVDLDLSAATQLNQFFSVDALSQDGYPPGSLVGLSIGDDGIITARFSNGQTQAYGQIALANFRNIQGLSEIGDGVWVETSASGQPTYGAPTEGSLGELRSGALEDSNVDLTTALVDMMTAQRTYQANAQTIKTQDAVMQTLVSMR
jgi:flagellar hook protein FlgE